MVEITVVLIPVGKTTEREVAALRTEVQGAVQRLRGVERVGPVRSQAPEGAKGVAEAVGAFLVGLPAGAVSDVFDVIKGVLTRPAQPPAKVKVTADDVELEFDPRRVSLDDMASFVERLRPKGAA